MFSETHPSPGCPCPRAPQCHWLRCPSPGVSSWMGGSGSGPCWREPPSGFWEDARPPGSLSEPQFSVCRWGWHAALGPAQGSGGDVSGPQVLVDTRSQGLSPQTFRNMLGDAWIGKPFISRSPPCTAQLTHVLLSCLTSRLILAIYTHPLVSSLVHPFTRLPPKGSLKSTILIPSLPC